MLALTIEVCRVTCKYEQPLKLRTIQFSKPACSRKGPNLFRIVTDRSLQRALE